MMTVVDDDDVDGEKMKCERVQGVGERAVCVCEYGI